MENVEVREKETYEQACEKLNRELGVNDWSTPFATSNITKPLAIDAPGLNAPAWWHGDEEASQSFLQAMGIHLNG